MTSSERVIVRRKSYRAYEEDWLKQHITVEKLNCLADDWRNDVDNSRSGEIMTIFDYLYAHGFAGHESPVCFEEFMHNEYLDQRYMEDILDDETFAQYLDDMRLLDEEGY